MRRIVDLTRPIDSADRELLPPEVGNIFAPRVRVLTPAGDGAIRMSEAFGCPVEDLPGGEGWAEEFLDDMNTHCGTHVDAPLHSGSMSEGRPARRIDEIALDELVRAGARARSARAGASRPGLPAGRTRPGLARGGHPDPARRRGRRLPRLIGCSAARQHATEYLADDREARSPRRARIEPTHQVDAGARGEERAGERAR